MKQPNLFAQSIYQAGGHFIFSRMPSARSAAALKFR